MPVPKQIGCRLIISHMLPPYSRNLQLRLPLTPLSGPLTGAALNQERVACSAPGCRWRSGPQLFFTPTDCNMPSRAALHQEIHVESIQEIFPTRLACSSPRMRRPAFRNCFSSQYMPPRWWQTKKTHRTTSRTVQRSACLRLGGCQREQTHFPRTI